ncbi:MAG: hypothetical protein KAU14_08545, partial [Thermoplasmata archaeon]|nr:hypothetical protein [Thermoplasmata archaeon]
TAGGRTALIPTQGVVEIGEDHVWQEFWHGRWVHWDNWWSDGGTGVDVPETYDGNWWHVSVVWAFRPDDYIRNVNHRPYTPTGTLKITILDRFGEPVDGAIILANSHSYATKLNPAHTPFTPPPIPCFWNYTDTNGECLLKLGENDYTINIWSRLGSVPDQQISIEEGQEYSRTFVVDGRKPTHDIQPNNQGGISGDSETISFGFKVLEGTQEQVNLFEATRHPQPIFMNRDIDFFICDEENYVNYLKGYPFDCYDLEENAVEGTVEVSVPKDRDWYFVFSNTEPLQTGKKIEIVVEKVIENEEPLVEITEPVDGVKVEIGDIVIIKGNATDDSGIERLEISLNGGKRWGNILMNYNNPGWFYEWNTSNTSDGDYKIKVRAYDSQDCKGEDSIKVIVGKGDEGEDLLDELADNRYLAVGACAALAAAAVVAVVVFRRKKKELGEEYHEEEDHEDIVEDWAEDKGEGESVKDG